jgi:lipoyl(octanoyl) transferase|tara:strand:- start:100136 stop:100762 length:627 start_codon:yes stop_codon:yes gene_type:complete
MLIIRSLGTLPYSETWHAMKQFTDERTDDTPDEIWLLQHPPVYTQGQAGKPEHILNPGNIPIVQSDRGGQVTYHGPGQLIAYILMDIKRRNLGVRTLVCELERCLIRLLDSFDLKAETKPGAPGVYVFEKKIASIGLRVRKGCTYHGLALNINMDLKPFLGINPCGYAGLNMTQLHDHAPDTHIHDVETQLKKLFLAQFDGDSDATLR